MELALDREAVSAALAIGGDVRVGEGEREEGGRVAINLWGYFVRNG
jgi:hypothetical protein